MSRKGFEKKLGVPASPLAMPGQVESGKKTDPAKGLFPSKDPPYLHTHIAHY